MDNLTAEQTLQLANQLTSILSNIGQYRHANFETLNADQNKSFEKSMITLSDAAGILYAYTPLIALKEAHASLNKLKEATVELDNVIKTINDIQKWIDIASISFSLATSILSHDFKGIESGINDLVGSIKKLAA